MIVRIKRQDSPTSTPYNQSFDYPFNTIKTVAGIIDDLNYLDDLVDVHSNSVRRISWECSCMQKICGACAMIVNNEPCLACSKFVDPSVTKELVLEPLSKFPVICDLMVDRKIILEYQKNAKLYLDSLDQPNQKEAKHQYEVSKCLKCGLCLEVCPNYKKEGSKFYGGVFANDAYLTYTLTENKKEDVLEKYKQYFESGCSKSLACNFICPAHMPTLSSIAFMNRQKKSDKNR